ncbi:MAG TPA: phospho-sugar mutase [Eubacteriales bacterium]|nr:phospho-sugar mutase [Eubacteriales bacterium]
MDAQSIYSAWCAEPTLDAATKAELLSIRDDPSEIEDRFYRELEFGTAGLRGVLGAGTNRMNDYVVRRATQGLADYLASVPGARERGVCIAYDSRLHSDEFAKQAACVLAGNGVKTYLFTTLHSVPQLSYAVRHLGCMAGVVITASHNPKQYNGYKVYWAYGGQVAPEQAAAIFEKIQAVGMFAAVVCDFDQAVLEERIVLVGKEEDEAYYAATAALLLEKELVRQNGGSLPIVYTPLHGTGAVPVKELLHRVGLTNVTMVPQQAAPDGTFPTVTAPNPEDPDAFRLAIALAEKTRARVCLATDPDADRLGVAVKTANDEWVTLTGNQIGCILLEHVLSTLDAQGKLPDNGVVIKSIVSTRLADAICRAYGVELENVLTGFRFIGEKVDEYQTSGEKKFLFGFEESFGYLIGGLARDKDAICAAMFAAEACIAYAKRGMTLSDALNEIYAKYGHYAERVKAYTLEGKEGMEKISACMRALRADRRTSFAGTPAAVCEDYLSGKRTFVGGETEKITLPESNVLKWILTDDSWIVVRPSGTEPKLKVYIGARAENQAAVESVLTALLSDVDALLTRHLFA